MKDIDMTKPYNDLPLLPPYFNFDDVDILKALTLASRSLSYLNGIDSMSENKISFLILEPLITPESVESSAIENINTTVEKVFRAEISKKNMGKNEKEVIAYKEALLKGFNLIKERSIYTNNNLEEVQLIIEPDKGGFRKIIGTKLQHEITKEIIYYPPEIGFYEIKLDNLDVKLNQVA